MAIMSACQDLHQGALFVGHQVTVSASCSAVFELTARDRVTLQMSRLVCVHMSDAPGLKMTGRLHI